MSLLNSLERFWNYPFLEKLESLSELYWLLKTRYYYRCFFGRIGKHSKILKPMRLKNVHNIYVGDDVLINKHSFLLTRPIDAARTPRLVIDSGSVLGHFNHIACVDEVYIGKKVLTADRVHIADNSHGFSNPGIPIIDQGVISKGKVSIGEGTWIGENASILSCRIGKNCVIGSNAVVINDVADFCVAVGVPARVVRRFDPLTGNWQKVEKGGMASRKVLCSERDP